MKPTAFPRSRSRRGVLLCLADPRVRRRLESALRDRAVVRTAGSPDECQRTLAADEESIGTVIVDAWFDRLATLETLIGRVAAEYPHVGILFLADRTDRATIRAATLAGAHALLLRDVHDQGAALREQLNAATMEAARRATFHLLEPVVPQRLHRFARRCLVDLEEETTLTDIARRLRVTRQTLFNRCIAEGLCGPEELRSWCRMLLAAHVLCWTSWTSEQVSLALGFPSVTALRNGIKRYIGWTASELRSEFGPERVLSAFLRRLVEFENAEQADAI